MISRLSAIAAAFAVLSTATLVFATGPQNAAPSAQAAPKVVVLETVVVTGRRLPAGQN